MDSAGNSTTDTPPNTMRLLQMKQQKQRSDPPASLAKSNSVTLAVSQSVTSQDKIKKTKSDKQDRKVKKKNVNTRPTSSNSQKGANNIALTRTKSSDSLTETQGHPLKPELTMMSDHSEVDIYGRKVTSDSENTASTNVMTDSERSEEDHPSLTPVLASTPGADTIASTSSVADEKSVKTQKTSNTVDSAGGTKRRKSKKAPKKIDESTHTDVSSSVGNDEIRKVKKSKSSSSDIHKKHHKMPRSDKDQKRASKSKSTAPAKEQPEDGANVKAGLTLSADQVAARLEEIGKLEKLLMEDRKSLEEGNVTISCERQIFEFFFKEEAAQRRELASEVSRLQLQLIGAHQGERAAMEQSAALRVEIEKCRAKLNALHEERSESYVQELQKENDYLRNANEKLLRQVDQQGMAFANKLKRKEETVDYLVALLGKMKTMDGSSHPGKIPSPSLESPKSGKEKGKIRIDETDLLTPTTTGKGKGKIKIDKTDTATPTKPGKGESKSKIDETVPVTPKNTEATKSVLVRLMKPKSLKKEGIKKKTVSRDILDADALKPPLVG